MTDRLELTEKIIRLKIEKNLKWSAIAACAHGLSKEYVTAALLGQQTLPEEAAKAIGQYLELTDYEIALLQQPPFRGSLSNAIPSDPTIYRFYELLSVYGTTFKALIHEEFGDGIMSAIDFNMDIAREPNPQGDRVKIVLSGKFLPYKTY